MKKYLSIIFLIFSNSIPLIGVIFWQWHIFPILVAYWLENVSVGFWNFWKIRKAQGSSQNKSISLTVNGVSVAQGNSTAMAFFFILHYGIFTTVHGVFIFIFVLINTVLTKSFSFSVIPEVLLAALVTFISHGISYFNNYVGKQEYLDISPVEQMFKPYGRMIAMHIAILLGASTIFAAGSPLPMLIILIGIKTGIDLFSHIREHPHLTTKEVLTESSGTKE